MIRLIDPFPGLRSFCGCELDIHGVLIMSGAQNGNGNLFKIVFSTQRAFGLPSKCCVWGMANRFKHGFSFLLPSPGPHVARERFCPQLVSSLSFRAIGSAHSIRILLISPQERSVETLKRTPSLCLKTHSVTQKTGLYWYFSHPVSGIHHEKQTKKKKNSSWLM